MHRNAGGESPLGSDGSVESVNDRPLRVQMLGLLPAVLQPCGAACARPFMNKPVDALSDLQHQETPGFVTENGERAHAIAEQLFRDFGQAVRIEVVGLDSLQGMLLGARHRIGRGFAIVVDRTHVVRDPQDYASVKKVVAQALHARKATVA